MDQIMAKNFTPDFSSRHTWSIEVPNLLLNSVKGGKTFLVRFSDGHCQTTPTNWCYETLENKPIKPEETRFDIARKLGPRFFNPKIPDISNLYQFENHEKLA